MSPCKKSCWVLALTTVIGIFSLVFGVGYSYGQKWDAQEHAKWSKPYQMTVKSVGPKLSNGWQRHYTVALVSSSGKSSVRPVSYENGLPVGYQTKVAFKRTTGEMGYYDSIGFIPFLIGLVFLGAFVGVIIFVIATAVVIGDERRKSKKRKHKLAAQN